MHCLLEMHGCSPALLNDSRFALASLREAAELAGATWLDALCHRFEPQGVTIVGLLAESHIAVHTWPERGYAAADVFTCGDRAMPRAACDHLVRVFGATSHRIREIDRGWPDAATILEPICIDRGDQASAGATEAPPWLVQG